jgi:hypothetical protein
MKNIVGINKLTSGSETIYTTLNQYYDQAYFDQHKGWHLTYREYWVAEDAKLPEFPTADQVAALEPYDSPFAPLWVENEVIA